MNGRQRATLSGVHRIEQRTCFGSAHLTWDDSVGTVAKRRFEERIMFSPDSLVQNFTLVGRGENFLARSTETAPATDISRWGLSAKQP